MSENSGKRPSDFIKESVKGLMKTIESEDDLDARLEIDFEDFFALNFGDIPVRKCNKDCPIYDRCQMKDSIEYNSSCPLELMFVAGEVESLMKQLDVDPSDVVTITQFMNYAALNLLTRRIYEQLAKEGITIEAPVVGKDQVIATVTEAHPLLDVLIRLDKMKLTILEQYLATPLSKVKAKMSDEGNLLEALARAAKDIETLNDEEDN